MNILSGLKPYIVYIINIANKNRRSKPQKREKQAQNGPQKNILGKSKKVLDK